MYLEIGVDTGACFLRLKARKKIAVDPKIKSSTNKKFRYCFKNICSIFNEYYEVPSDDFFAAQESLLSRHRLDVVLIDGLHTYSQSLRDFEHSLKWLKDGGVIMMHD